MSHSEQVGRFHKQLIALQLAGFDVIPQLVGRPAQSSIASSESKEALEQVRDWKAWLEGFSTQFDDLDSPDFDSIESQYRDGLEGPPASLPSPTKPALPVSESQLHFAVRYKSCFQQWRIRGERIDSLAHLVATTQVDHACRQGLQVSLLSVATFSSVALVTLFILLSTTLRGISGFIALLGVEPAWPLSILLQIRPHFWIVLVGYVGLVVATVAVLKLRNVRTLGLRTDSAYRWLRLAQNARVRADFEEVAASKSKLHDQASDWKQQDPASLPSPLLDWASQLAGSTADRVRVLGLVQRLYTWLGYRRTNAISRTRPQLVGTAVGGALALTAGFFLFYPLVQTLVTVINTSGLNR